MAEQVRRAFITGCPVTHSRSPVIHSHWLDRYGIAGSYERHPVAPGAVSAFFSALRDGSAGFIGGNVTIPHKEEAFRLADEADETTSQIGAANTLWVRDGKVHATNTDTYGFAANLDERHPGWDGDGTALVLGAGGASRAVLHALLTRSIPEILLVNRTLDRARELADRFGARVRPLPLEALGEAVADTRLFVNTTSLGMDGSPVPVIDFSAMAPGALVTDIVYVPLETPFLRMARAAGVATVDGLGMLLHQAVPGFEIWFGRKPEVDTLLRQAVERDMAGTS